MSSSRRSSGGGGGGSKIRSPSPNPSAASSPFRTRRSIAGTTLSKESLYAPLTTYLPKKQAAAASATTSSDKNDGRGRKSPGGIKFQSIPRELREAALVDHLSTISSAYHHPTLSASLASGNRESMGMGRNNGGRSLPRRSYEDRLLQRSLVLVGGGLMTSSVAGSSGGIDGDGGNEPSASASRHVVDVSRAQRRKRRRERGHRVRGSISNSERKRREMAREEGIATATAGGVDVSTNNSKKRKRGNATYAHDTLLKLNEIWNSYISQLLGLEQNPDNGTMPSLLAVAGSNRQRRSTAELSALLSSAELVGGFVRIDRCDASRAYMGREGIVVDSTANAWRIALPRPVIEKKKKEKEKMDGADDKEEKTDDAPNQSNEEEDDTTVSVVWKEVVVAKTRSTLSFTIDTGRNDDVPGNYLRIDIGQV